MIRLVLACTIGCVIVTCGAAMAQTTQPSTFVSMDEQLKVVDEYLIRWDLFAQGSNELVPYLRDNKKAFEIALAQLLRAHDRRAISRLVFYPVVQVGGVIAVDSDLGQAAQEILGKDFPVTTTKDGHRVFFCCDLYFWWEKHQKEFEHFPTFDQWLTRDFAQKTVLPMYAGLQKQTR